MPASYVINLINGKRLNQFFRRKLAKGTDLSSY